MQLRHLQSITQPSDGIQKVTAICFAPNGKRLAVCTTDRVVLMFDEDGVRKDKFSTKPADKVSDIYIYIKKIGYLVGIYICIWHVELLYNCNYFPGTKKLCGETDDIFSSI